MRFDHPEFARLIERANLSPVAQLQRDILQLGVLQIRKRRLEEKGWKFEMPSADNQWRHVASWPGESVADSDIFAVVLLQRCERIQLRLTAKRLQAVHGSAQPVRV